MEIECIAADPGRPISDRARAKLISDAWERREGLKDLEREIIEARLAIENITRECEQLQTALAEKDARIHARRLGKPVVLVDPNRIRSAVSSPHAHRDPRGEQDPRSTASLPG